MFYQQVLVTQGSSSGILEIPGKHSELGLKMKYVKIKIPLSIRVLSRVIREEEWFVIFSGRDSVKIHTYHSRYILEGVAGVSQIFLRDTHVLPKFVSYEELCRSDGW
jgi:hypothetical protein